MTCPINRSGSHPRSCAPAGLMKVVMSVICPPANVSTCIPYALCGLFASPRRYNPKASWRLARVGSSRQRPFASPLKTVAETKRVSASTGTVQLDDEVDITVVAGIPAASTSDAKVPKGRRLRFTDIEIKSRDAFGNDIHAGGFSSRFSIFVSGTNSATPTVHDNGDGTYSASYLPISKGTDRIDIMFDGVPINGSPYLSDVK